MARTLSLLAFIAFFLFPSGDALAFDISGPQPPAPYGVFSTLSADSPRTGRSAVAFMYEKSGEPDFSRYSTQLAVAVTNTVEFGMNIPYVDNDATGIEDIAFHLKHRFFEEGMYGPSVAYLVTASLASNNEEYSTDGRGGLGIIASKRVGPVKAHLNLIYSKPWDSSLEDEIRFSAGIDFAASHDFRILAELLTRKSHFSDEVDHQEARVGYRFMHDERTFSTIGVGFGMSNKPPDFRIIASVSLIFPRSVKGIKKIYEEE